MTCPIVHLARELCLSKVKVSEFDYVLWIDSDMLFNAEQLDKLLMANKNVVGALYKSYENQWVCGFDKDDNLVKVTDENLALDDTFLKVDYCGFGFLLMKTAIFNNLKEWPFRPLSEHEYKKGEDYTFCKRLRESGETIFIHKEVKVLHEKKFAI